MAIRPAFAWMRIPKAYEAAGFSEVPRGSPTRPIMRYDCNDRVATPRNEDMLLYIAFNGTAWHVERAVSVWRREKRLQAVERENDRHALRELSWYYDDDGCLVMHARFTPEQGAVIRQNRRG